MRIILITTVFLSVVSLISGCSKLHSNSDVRQSNRTSFGTETKVNVQELSGMKVQELLVVIFQKDYTPEKWKSIFASTKILSQNRKQLRVIEGKVDEPSSSARIDLIGKNAEILTWLGEQSAFLMNWSAQDENCKLKSDDLNSSVFLKCRPRNRDNPLSGGLPKALAPIAFYEPDPVTSQDIKIPYLSLHLGTEPSSEYRYSMELRLKLEYRDSHQVWLKGDVVPGEGSTFQSWNGSVSSEFFPYGYSELLLEE